jgi:hypothetical protein
VRHSWRWEKGKLTSGVGVAAAVVRKARGRAACAGDGAPSGLGRDVGWLTGWRKGAAGRNWAAGLGRSLGCARQAGMASWAGLGV